jgi:hypothetical protein
LTGFAGGTGKADKIWTKLTELVFDRITGFSGNYRIGGCAFFGLFLCVRCVLGG